MKKIIVFILCLNLISCSSNDCFDEGTIQQKEINVPFFDKITVGNEVTLILKQGITQQVIIETGANLWEEITYKVEDNQFYISDKNTCNLSRDYAITKVYITSPNIEKIRSDTAREILSDGVLNYPNLTIYSENYHEDTLTNADINLQVNCINLNIVANGSSVFTIKGASQYLGITFASGSSRFNGNELLVNNIVLSQKSTNDMLIHPITSLTGHLFSIGNVISYNNPISTNITEHYTGKLIFN
ncbi:MAG: head GIN domain-containing protein [Flavobacteriaceae bacterium]